MSTLLLNIDCPTIHPISHKIKENFSIDNIISLKVKDEIDLRYLEKQLVEMKKILNIEELILMINKNNQYLMKIQDHFFEKLDLLDFPPRHLRIYFY